jgi:hypothetical protein
MIPVCCKDFVTYTDESSGIVYRFKPKTGILERKVNTLALSEFKPVEGLDELNAIIDEILLLWDDTKKVGMPNFDSQKPSTVFHSEEKWKLINFWNKANSLSAEEKKI